MNDCRTIALGLHLDALRTLALGPLPSPLFTWLSAISLWLFFYFALGLPFMRLAELIINNLRGSLASIPRGATVV